MYHYVRPDSSRLPFFRHLHIDDFRQQLDYFETNYELIDRERFLDSLNTGVAAPNGCVLTFDDGFKDHYQYVLPELTSRGLWGVFYVPTGMYESGELRKQVDAALASGQ